MTGGFKMTRKEAFKKLKEIDNSVYISVLELEELISEIFDDLKNQKCKNCKDFKDGECRIFAGAVVKDTTGRVSKEDFYCKYFEERR